MTAISGRQRLLDGAAIGASTLCLVHCLVLPALLVLVPTLTAFLTVPESFHAVALTFAVPTSALALAAGYRRHRLARPAMIVVPGIVLLALGGLAASAEWIETALTVPGALLLAIGHALNWGALRHHSRAPDSTSPADVSGLAEASHPAGKEGS